MLVLDIHQTTLTLLLTCASYFLMCKGETCEDKSVAGRLSDCPSNKQRCNDLLWKQLMEDQCPKTCGRCNTSTTSSALDEQTSEFSANTYISATIPCLDGTGPNGVSECSKFLERCTDPLWSDVMRKTCPRSCGFCSTESSSDSLGSSDQDFYSQEEKKGNQLNLSASPFISIDEVPFINGWTVKKLRDYNASTGSFPPVEEYLPADYIENLLDLFRDGVSFLMTENSLDQFGREMLGKPDNNRFVIPRAYMDLVLLTANGNISVIESELGIPAGHWRGHQMVRIDVPEPQKLNLRMATGNENGANQLWIPGGLLPNGIPEAIIDNVPEGMYTETRLQFPRWMQHKWQHQKGPNDTDFSLLRHFLIPIRV